MSREAAAQAVTGTILGTVTDPTGAVLPGATVTVTNQDTGFSRTVVSDAQGEYVTPQLPTGVYTVAGELSGFKGMTLSNIRLGVDQRVRIDLKLEVGDIAETITIEAATPLVQASSSELGTTIEEEQIKTLPLNGRNFVSLTRTVPGVLRGNPGANIDGAGSLAWRASASFSANGQRPRDNNYMLDGVDNNETWLQTVVLFPSVDALDEFKLQTSTYSAEFGRSLGGIVNLQIKSGTNAFRGSLYEFHRNDALDANNFFNNRNGRAKPDFRQNQFGGTLGGPVFRDRTFFFFDYQGSRIAQGQTYLSTVPSEKMRRGDFSEVNRVIYNPLTGQPFPGNIVPESMWDPAARNIMSQLYPAPNVPGRIGANGQPLDNYLINPTLEREDDQFDIKVDHNLTVSNRFFTRYSWAKTHRFLPATLPHGDAGATFGAGDGNIDAQGLAFNDTHTFNDRWLNEFRFGWTSIKFNMTSIDHGKNLAAQMGIPNINLNDATSAMSQITFQNIRNLGANGNQPLITNQNDFQIFDNVTWIKGRHTLKAGGSITFRSREVLNADLIVGQFAFNNNQTSNCAGRGSDCVLDPNTGFDVASFLLGFASAKNRRLFDAETYTEKKPEYALYIQDDFRVTHNLTVNMGLRWDVFPPWIEVDDRQSNFDPSTGKFVVASPDAVINGVRVGRYLQTYSKGDVGPRFGFAYDVGGDGRTVIRGGWGVFWNFTPGGTSSSKAQNPPFLKAQALTPTPTTTGINLRLSEGLPPPVSDDPNLPARGATRSIFDINFRDGYAHNFNLNIQRQFGQNYLVEVAYAGSRGRQLMAKVNPNQAPPVVGVTNSNVNRPFARIAPELRNIGQAASIGYVDYNGLLIKFQRRFADNFSFLNSYTWGKAIDINSDNDGDVTFTNVYDIENYHRGPADYDVAHTFSSSWIYELPWARDRAWGGWQLNGILFLRSGLPFTVTQTQGVQSTGTGNRPNRICDGRLDNPTIDRWFDASCFVPPADTTGTYGNAGRNILRGPGQFNIDASLIKRTRIGRFLTEIRIEAFNVLNHPQFAPRPNSTIGNANVGTITSMLPNPACALCGTTERQVQIAGKVSF
ncbi:MAG TPA: carboxypeptidase-like regulatory domain-containing protein [Vicinamibacterales bacterium]|nr:carboxypeptidase-like regulatory domain-containing protein [Vicinamibacterales bacterium]